MAHLFIVVVNDSFNRKNVNLSQIYYVLDFSFFMSQDDAYYHIHQNDPKTVGSKRGYMLQLQCINIWSTSRLSHCNCLTTDFLKPPAGHFSRLAYNIISRFVQSRGTWYVGNVREDIHLLVSTPRREGRSGLYSKKDYKKEKRSRINLSWCKFYHGQNIFYI